MITHRLGSTQYIHIPQNRRKYYGRNLSESDPQKLVVMTSTWFTAREPKGRDTTS